MGVKHIHIQVTEEEYDRLDEEKDGTWREMLFAGAGLEEGS